VTNLAEPATLLDAWDRAGRVPPVARGAVLVHGAGLTASLDEALDLDVGRCAVLALRAYRDAFGDSADAVVVCPECGEVLEAQLPVLLPDDPGRALAPSERVVGDWVVRAPTTRDLLIAAREPANAEEVLRSRCVRPRASAGGPALPVGDAPALSVGDGLALSADDGPTLAAGDAPAFDAAAEELAGVGALVSAVTCPACGTTLEAAFDAAAVLWEQVASTAPGVLADVATLARAFGWSEAAVLALPANRRRAYLAMAAL
jgi:uncharacterized protein (UPF0212 family)